MNLSEKELHKKICTHLRDSYESVIFTTDMSGIRLSKGQAIAAKTLRSGNGVPDILIFEASGDYNGLFLEVKKSSPYKKTGELYKDDHLTEQDLMHRRLELKGYLALFVWDYESAVGLIKEYMNLTK